MTGRDVPLHRPGQPDGPFAPAFTKAEGQGASAAVDRNGDFLIGPDYRPAPELARKDGVPRGVVEQFTMESRDSRAMHTSGVVYDRQP